MNENSSQGNTLLIILYLGNRNFFENRSDHCIQQPLKYPFIEQNTNLKKKYFMIDHPLDD